MTVIVKLYKKWPQLSRVVAIEIVVKIVLIWIQKIFNRPILILALLN